MAKFIKQLQGYAIRARRAWRVLRKTEDTPTVQVEVKELPEIVERNRKELRAELTLRMRRATELLKRTGKEGQAAVPMSWAAMQPAPGVLPSGAAMAMDSDTQATAAWASSNMGAALAEGQAFLGYPTLALLAQRPEYRVISQTWAEEMTRGWIKLVSTGTEDQEAKADKLHALEKAMKHFKVREHFRKCIEDDGYFGRAHLYVDTGADFNDSEELRTSIGSGANDLSKAKVAVGTLRAFRVVEAVWTYPNGYNANDPLRDDFYRPESWFVMGKSVHRTRLLTFTGRPVPDLLKPSYSFGGLSLTQMAKPYVDNWLRTRQSVSDMLSAFSITVLLTDLSTMLDEGAATDLNTRIDFFNAARDNRGLMVADKNDEDLKNVAVPLSGLDHLQAQAQEQMSSITQIPLVKSTGISPSGLNASSEGELRVFYDKVKSRQEAEVRPPLEIVLQLLQLNEFGDVDPDIGFEFIPLWEPTAAEKATTNKTNVDADVALIDRGVISAQEARTRLANDAGSPYPSLDTSDSALPVQESDVEDDAPDGAADAALKAAGVLLTCKGRVLLLRRAATDISHPSQWDLPGGTLESGESALDGALRELAEEAGLKLPPSSVAEVWASDNEHYTVFAAKVSKQFKPVLSAEHDTYIWADQAEVPGPLVPGLAEVLELLFIAEPHN